jgi:hypothetical protein
MKGIDLKSMSIDPVTRWPPHVAFLGGYRVSVPSAFRFPGGPTGERPPRKAAFLWYEQLY